MRKKMQLIKKTIIFGIAVMLASCSEDLYEDQINKSNIKIQRISMNDSKFKENYKLMKSVDNLLLDQTNNALSRYEYNSEYDFFIDKENGVFLENDNLESYTFPAYKSEKDSLITNVIFNKTLSGDFDVIVAKYDLLKSEINELTKEELMAADVEYVNITNRFRGPELICFERQEYVMVPINQGELTGVFGYEGIWVTTFSYCYWSDTGGGDGSNQGNGNGTGLGGNTGGVLTSPTNSPHGGGGGGSPNNNLQQTPCETLNDVMQSVDVSQAIQNLKTQTQSKGESGYEISKKYDALSDSYTYGTKLKNGDNFGVVLKTGSFRKGGAHNHPINSQFIPSIGDVKWLKNCQNDIYPSTSNAFSLIVCPNASSLNDPNTAIVYAITVDNLEILQNEINNVYGADFENLSDNEKAIKADEILAIYSKKFKDVQNSSSGLENKFLSTFANFGISLYKLDSNNNWNKLNLVNNTVTPQPCE